MRAEILAAEGGARDLTRPVLPLADSLGVIRAMSLRAFFGIVWLVVVVSLLPDSAAADRTEQVFGRYKDRLLQVRVVDTTTATKSNIGSGFFVDDAGLIATNYHVVAKHVFKPEKYRIEYIGRDDTPHTAELLTLDVVHDLALLRADERGTAALSLRAPELSQGERIYTLGDPLDLGMTIVEGTYNGLTDDTMHERILLSSALNPGMSGGPSITADGEVVGINVATTGNDIGFLVPARYLRALMEQRDDVPSGLMALIRRQLLANQDQYLGRILDAALPRKQLGAYMVPDRFADYLSCWGDSDDQTGPYRESTSHCTVKNKIFLNQGVATGQISFTHRHLRSSRTNPYRFYHIVQKHFSNPVLGLGGSKEYFTEFECKDRLVGNAGIRFKIAYCLRAYRDFDGLYDMVLNAVTLTEQTTALQSTLALGGVSFNNARRFAQAYLERFRWKQ